MKEEEKEEEGKRNKEGRQAGRLTGSSFHKRPT